MNEALPNSINFYGRDFLVTKDVLIPRPESEMIIDAVLNLCGKPYLPGVKASASKIAEDLTIHDVGTGSGCLAITLACELPRARIIASDISLPALQVAKKNAKKHNAKITFYKSDLLEGLKLTSGPTSTPTPDLIVANLPYVDPEWPWLDKAALSVEPSIALYAENHGLALIYKLIDQIPKRTKFLILEADPSQHEKIIKYAKSHHLTHCETRGFVLVFQNTSTN
jgi:release factor glutamine methyltransferase